MLLKPKVPKSWLAMEPNYDKSRTFNVVRCYPDKLMVVPVVENLSEQEAVDFIKTKGSSFGNDMEIE